MSDETRQCAAEIEGQKIGGRQLPMWRRRCKNRVKPPYRYCHVHRYKEMPGHWAESHTTSSKEGQ